MKSRIPATVNQLTGVIQFESHQIKYEIVRSARSRKIRITHIRGGSFKITVPRAVSPSHYGKIVAEAKDWMIKIWHRTRLDEGSAFRPVCLIGGWIFYLGKKIALALDQTLPLGGAVLNAETLRIHPENQSESKVREVASSWLAGRAVEHIHLRLTELARELSIKIGRISVRAQKSRWGSCAHNGNISINWRLIVAPPEILDYVLVHELMHRRQPNHSAAFWKLVAERIPDHAAHRAWLKKNRSLLTFG